MIECKVTLPWFAADGEELKQQHDDLREKLIRRFGLVKRIKTESFYHQPNGKLCINIGFEYSIFCNAEDSHDFQKICVYEGRAACQQHLALVTGQSTAKIMDLADLNDVDNWRVFANKRLKARNEANCAWSKKRVK